MSRILVLWLFFSLAFLAGCAPGVWEDIGLPADPNEQVALGQARQTSTAQAALVRAAKSTEEALRAQEKAEQEIAVIMAPIRAEETRVALAITAGAVTAVAAQATSTAQAAQTTAIYQAAAAISTQAAVERKEQADQIKSIAWNIYGAVGILAIVVLAIRIAYVLLKRWEDAQIENERERLKLDRLKNSVRIIDGVTYWLDDDGRPQVIKPAAPAPAMSAHPRPALDASWNQFRPLARPPRRDTQGLALELVERGISLWGDYAIQLPGWRKMNWTPSRWQRVTAPMKAQGIIETNPDPDGEQGTFLAEGGPYANLHAFRLALVNEDIVLKPDPPPYPPPRLAVN